MAMTETKSRSKAPHGVQSAETVLQVLNAFVGIEKMPMLKTLADRIGMHPAKVHRYLVSLCRTGYVVQDEFTSRYRLGPAALKLGFAAMSAVDAVRVARPLLADFCRSLEQTVVLALWTASGPTIVLRETRISSLAMTAPEGLVVPILRSSVGNVFGAYLPRPVTQTLIDKELAELRASGATDAPTSIEEAETLFATVRKRGAARTIGQFSAGSHSFAVPVFAASGEIEAVLCTLGPATEFNSSWSSPLLVELLKNGQELSRRLGYSPADRAAAEIPA